MPKPDLNLDGLPLLQAAIDFAREQFDYSVPSERFLAELRQLVERERKAAWNDGFLYALRAEEEGRRLAREEIERG